MPKKSFKLVFKRHDLKAIIALLQKNIWSIALDAAETIVSYDEKKIAHRFQAKK